MGKSLVSCFFDSQCSNLMRGPLMCDAWDRVRQCNPVLQFCGRAVRFQLEHSVLC